jgi:hypothetical protein
MCKSARHYGPNRTTQAGISNPFRLSFPGRVTYERTPVSLGRDFWEQLNSPIGGVRIYRNHNIEKAAAL